MDFSEDGVAVLDAAVLTYEDFQRTCLASNRPALILNASAAFRTHPAACSATSGSSVGGNGPVSGPMIEPMPHLLTAQGLTNTFGDLSAKVVPVYHCPDPVAASPQQPSSTPTTECMEVSIQAVFDSWVSCTARRLPFHHPERLYLMNWHYQHEAETALLPTSPEAAGAGGESLYDVPSFLGFDLMHAYHLHCRGGGGGGGGVPLAPSSIPFGDGTSDYRFVYVGVEDTWTPLHHDVFGSFSWSLNLSGKKVWYLLTPDSQIKAQELWGSGASPPPDIRVVANLTFDTVVQKEGQLIFVPSRWYHQVHNVEGAPYAVPPSPTLGTCHPRVVCSINHNWMSFDQLPTMVSLLLQEVKEVMRKTDKETRSAFTDAEWMEIVDRMLLGSGAWNVSIVRSFLGYARAVLTHLDKEVDDVDRTDTELPCPMQWEGAAGARSLFSRALPRDIVSSWKRRLDCADNLLKECEQLLLCGPPGCVGAERL